MKFLTNIAKSYSIYVFRKTFPQFSEYWFKLKEIGISSNVQAIKLSNNYRKENFFKNVRSTFSKFSDTAESMLKMIKKQFNKDETLVHLEFDKFQEFIVQEYSEMEKFAIAAYEEALVPSSAEIQACLIEHRT